MSDNPKQRGRKIKSPAGHTIRVTITICPDRLAWLKSQGGMSETIAKLIDEARQRT